MTTETENLTPTEMLRQQIAEHRRVASLRRVCAFVRGVPERVMGIPLRPITPATVTLLQATGSRFLSQETPMEGDVRNFLWFHSPLFMRDCWWTVPTFARWLALLPFNAQLHRRRDMEWYAALLALTITEIRGLVATALADVPGADGKGDSAPVGACLEAQLVTLFVDKFHWEEARVRHTPLARLFQYRRAMASGREEDPTERDIRFAHLRRRNEELAAQRAAKVDAVETVQPEPATLS